MALGRMRPKPPQRKSGSDLFLPPPGWGLLTVEGRAAWHCGAGDGSGRGAGSRCLPPRPTHHTGHCRGHVSGRGRSGRTSGCSWALLGVGGPAGLFWGKEPGLAGAALPHLVLLLQGGPGSLAGPWPPRAKLPSVATGLATSLSTPPGISPPSSLCPQPVWGGARATLAASGRNPSDRGCGEGRAGLAYEARAVPEALGGPAAPGWGPELHGSRAAPVEGRLPPSQARWSRPQSLNPPPDVVSTSRTAGSRTAISRIGPHFPGQTLAGPSAGPTPGPLEGGPGRPGLAPATLQHGQVGTQALLACPSEAATRESPWSGHPADGSRGRGPLGARDRWGPRSLWVPCRPGPNTRPAELSAPPNWLKEPAD
ncbi:basic proline-rich protein-like [Phoca vitulina]|uniref:basic proline-rich protein-like n=1 Tax=Phoca vitulina TaxID=9720 RepID=UPI001395F9A4|nr:basic proline-rich protein-like [Phoca vitulina]